MCKKFFGVAAGAVEFFNTRSRFEVTLFEKIKKSIIWFNYSPADFYEGCRQRYKVKKSDWGSMQTHREEGTKK